MPIKRTKHWTQARAALEKAVQDAVAHSGVLLQNEIKMGFRGGSARGSTPAPAGQPPHVDTGTLRRSIQIDVSQLRNRVRPMVRVGSNLKYARIHEFGGVITAKKGYLTVPLTQEARNMRRRNATLRGQNLVPFRSKKGNLLLGKPMRAKGSKAYGKGSRSLKPMFLLTKKVRTPARPYMRPAARRARPKIIALFQARNLLKGLTFGGVR